MNKEDLKLVRWLYAGVILWPWAIGSIVIQAGYWWIVAVFVLFPLAPIIWIAWCLVSQSWWELLVLAPAMLIGLATLVIPERNTTKQAGGRSPPPPHHDSACPPE